MVMDTTALAHTRKATTMDQLLAFLTTKFFILTDPDNREKGASAVEYILIVLGAIAIVAIVIVAVTTFVQNKTAELG